MARKLNDDPAARRAAGETIARAGGLDIDAADPIVAAFDAAEYETSTTRHGGQTITLRRVWLAGPWQVVQTTNAGSASADYTGSPGRINAAVEPEGK